MDDKKTGKRLAEEKPSSPAAKRGLIVILAIVVALCAIYVALCTWASATGSTPLPRTTAAGLDIGGLSSAQIEEKLTQEFSHRAQSLSLTVSDGDQIYTIPGGALKADVATAAANATSWGSQGNFFGRGIRVLQGLISGHEVEVPVDFSPEGAAQVDQFLTQLESELGGLVQETTWTVEGESLVFHMGTPGRAVALNEVKAQLLQHFARGDSSALELSTQTTNPTDVDLNAVHAAVFAQVENAALDPETFEISPSTTGLDFDVSTARAALEGAAWGADVSVPLAVTAPSVTTQNLQELLFRDVMGSATSKVGGSGNRKSNVALAAASFNERILLPGEVFSYNTSTGSRTAEKGYKNAPVYKGGKSVDEVGGGICQPSSTLYLACLNGNLKIVERHKHSFAVGYVPDGLDATVYFGSLDYRFENDTDYPLKLVSESYKKDGATYLTVTIYGTKLDDLTVKMTNNVYNWVSYETVYQIDAAIPVGSVKEGQSGYTGRNADAYRNIYDGKGELVSSTLETTNKYAVRERILLVNPADAAKYGLNADGTVLTSPALPPETTPVTTTPAETTLPPAETTPVATIPAEVPTEIPVAIPPIETLPVAPTPGVIPTQAPPDIGIPIVSAAPMAEDGGNSI